MFSFVAHVFGRIKQCKSMVIWMDTHNKLPLKSALFGLLIQWPVHCNPSEETTQNPWFFTGKQSQGYDFRQPFETNFNCNYIIVYLAGQASFETQGYWMFATLRNLFNISLMRMKLKFHPTPLKSGSVYVCTTNKQHGIYTVCLQDSVIIGFQYRFM